MQLSRAQQILSSQDKINVEWNGVPVWIDSVDTNQATVKVHVEHQPAQTKVVSVEQLQEVQETESGARRLYP
ncbi:Small, acid-soluble spore protein H [Paenibacillus solanacearum]|uniref:Small, acid-soluble spore protein H n=1 Tax=Paenibacillus solanacearum TaxID=2048548 RepID=A0A916KA78_9BACL|nr:H-type small acid-soluble spore protein [Paenibacillus solanacearum]CAG7651007.1 Small, acid-soluble spore protein H [Paenibacillus solanacearum]